MRSTRSSSPRTPTAIGATVHNWTPQVAASLQRRRPFAQTPYHDAGERPRPTSRISKRRRRRSLRLRGLRRQLDEVERAQAAADAETMARMRMDLDWRILARARWRPRRPPRPPPTPPKSRRGRRWPPCWWPAAALGIAFPKYCRRGVHHVARARHTPPPRPRRQRCHLRPREPDREQPPLRHERQRHRRIVGMRERREQWHREPRRPPNAE